jgi:hypothetical protein
MRKIITTLCFTAAAASAQAQSFSGTAEAWAQWVGVTNALDDGYSCDAGGYEFCSNTYGGGAYLGGLAEFANGTSFYLDLTYDQHQESNNIPENRDDSARYAGIGAHFIFGPEEAPWGVFATYIEASNHADSDVAVPLRGLGVEKSWGPGFVQAGYMHRRDLSATVSEDGITYLGYLAGGYTWTLGEGELALNAALGTGDFDERGSRDKGEWVQAGLRYEAPLSGRATWFVGYQGDFVRVEETGNNEQALFHAVKAGISIPFGGSKKSPFRTPNFRAPITNAGEMN